MKAMHNRRARSFSWVGVGAMLVTGMLVNAPQAGAISATGGTVTNYTDAGGTNWMQHTFTTVGTDALNVIRGGQMDVLVVAGGGGGGNCSSYNAGGGGGGGGVIQQNALSVPVGTHTIVVGACGNSNAKGGNTTFTIAGGSVFTAVGGGSGGGMADPWNGKTGGSGGGGGPWGTGANGTAGQGNKGGNGFETVDNNRSGGGGGGAGGQGATATTTMAGAGGPGIQWLDGKWYGGGGGGAHATTGAKVAAGGSGGGGAGRFLGSNYTLKGYDGTANTGGGGGGVGGTGSSTGYGGKGGSGVVIVRYVVPPSGTLIMLQ